jgi:hypothetical protein
VADRVVNVKLSANVRDYSSSVNKAARDTEDLANKAEKFSGKTYRAKVAVDGAATASAEVAQLRARLEKVQGRYSASVRVDHRGASRDTAAIMNSIMALGPAAIAAGAAASGAMIALGSTLGVLAGGVGVSILAFSGLGDALEAMGQAELRSGVNAQKSAQDRAAATRQVDAARTAVVRAEQDQAQAAQLGERQIRDAKSAVSKAYGEAASANSKAAAEVEDSEDDLATAHQKVRYALEDLSIARQKAVRDLDDMRERGRDNALDEEQAEIRLIEARDKLVELNKTGAASEMDLRKARLAVAQADNALKDVRRDAARNASDLNAAEAAGVEGMPGVVSAKGDLAQAEAGVEQARRDLIKAQAEVVTSEREGNAKIAAAVQDLQDTRDDAARRNADAALSVSDAEARVQQAVADATIKMSEQSTEAKKLAEEMSKLGPAGQSFVSYLHALKPQMEELQALSQAGMFPGMEAGIDSLMLIFPDIIYFVDKTSLALGDMAQQAGDALNDPFWRGFIRFLADEAGPMFESFFRIAEGLARGLAGMQMAFNPMARDIVGGLEEMATKFAKWGASLSSNDGFEKFIQYVREVGPQVMGTLGSIADLIGSVAVAAAPLGPVVLGGIKLLADTLAFIAGIPGVGTTLIAVAASIGVINIAMRAMDIAKFSHFGLFLAGLPARAGSASTAMGVMALNMGASDKAATRMADSGDRVGRAMSGLGSAIPIAGIALVGLGMAYEEFGSKAEENAGKAVTGSISLREAIALEQQQVEKNVIWWGLGLNKQDEYADAADRVTQAYHDQFAKLDPLEQANSRVSLAQEHLNDMIERFGAYSPEARSATEGLTWASKDLEIQQLMTEEGIDRATAAMLRQKDAAIEAANADVSFERAKIGVESAVERAREATERYGAESWRSRDATLAVEDAAHRSAAAARDKAMADGEANGASNIAELGAKAQKDEYLRLADMVKEPLRAELLTLAQNIKDIPDGNFSVTGTGVTQFKFSSSGEVTGGPPGTDWLGLATGGYVSGPGTPTSDSINARLSNGEYVVRAAATRDVGVSTLEHINRTGELPAFAEGGVFMNGGGSRPLNKTLTESYRGDAKDIVAKLRPQLQAQVKLIDSGGNVGGALDWARAQHGKPYVWGGVGPRGYDCSGFMAAIMNVMAGKNPHSRRGTTATFPWPGMQPGMGPGLSVGNTKNAGGGIGHMAGTLAGVNVEAAGGGKGVRVGPSARGAQDRLFNTIWHMPGPANFAPGGAAGGDLGIGGSGVQRWRGVVNQALAFMRQPASYADLTLRRMNQESSGNPSIVNTWDSNARRGTPSVGLMQVIRPTYADNRPPPGMDRGPYLHGVSIDPMANIVSSMKYALKRYGSLPAAYNKAGGYDEGGLATGKGLLPKYTVAPERVLSPRQTAAFEQLVDDLTRPRPISSLMSGGGGSTVVKNFNLTVLNAGNSQVDLQAQFSRLELTAGV